MSRYDVVVWGATGFTGRLVAEYLAEHRPDNLRWALGGRSEQKLREVRTGLAALDSRLADLPILVGDSHDRAALDAIVTQTRVMCTTVGPYARYGSELVAACVEAGIGYCDLNGEVPWMRRMIDAHHDRAKQKGARIVFCCGFDSIPSDLGCFLLQQSARQRHDRACNRAVLYVDRMRGGASGGTVASMMNIVDEATRDREVRRLLGDPYALNPEAERSGPDHNEELKPTRTEDGRWTAPFVMAAINTRIVRRSNALLGYPYGRDFRYAERVRFAAGPKGWLGANAMAAGIGGLMAGLAFAPTRTLLERVLPSPGEGPSREQRERGSFLLRIEGDGPGFSVTARVEDSSDPGYGSTAKMLAESALCLALDKSSSRTGMLTPASAMGMTLIDRLRRAGLTFDVA